MIHDGKPLTECYLTQPDLKAELKQMFKELPPEIDRIRTELPDLDPSLIAEVLMNPTKDWKVQGNAPDELKDYLQSQLDKAVYAVLVRSSRMQKLCGEGSIVDGVWMKKEANNGNK